MANWSTRDLAEHYRKQGDAALNAIAKACGGAPLPSLRKYGERKKVVDGIEFDSSKEARAYQTLVARLRLGDLVKLERQVEFVLQEKCEMHIPCWSCSGGGCRHCKNGEIKRNIRSICMVVDFVIRREEDTRDTVVEVKSKATRTRAYMIKRKMFAKRYPEYGYEEWI